jgi:hypothetical protein
MISTLHFSTSIYLIENLNYTDILNDVTKYHLDDVKKEFQINPSHPVVHTKTIFGDDRLFNFCNDVLTMARDIVLEQGYSLNEHELYISEMWCQEHHFSSGMDKHIHGQGSVLSGFYFFQENVEGCKVEFSDPRPSKEYGMILPKSFSEKETSADNIIHMHPKKGFFVFINSWLPHSISRNQSQNPFRFVHYNISAVPKHFLQTTSKAIII